MDNLLPCPFCGSSNLALEDKGAFISCKTPGCGGRHFYNQDQWQKRAVVGINYQQAYAQFEASLQAEREKKTFSKVEQIIIQEALTLGIRRKWINGPPLGVYALDLRDLIAAIREYSRLK